MGLTEMSRRRRRRGLPLRTAVYRFYGADGALLYVGMSENPAARMDDHHAKPWWPQVCRRELEWFDNQWLAADEETALIRTAKPNYNIQCRGGPWQRNAAKGVGD